MAHEGEGQDGNGVHGLEKSDKLKVRPQISRRVFVSAQVKRRPSHLRVEDKVLRRAGVLAVVHGGGVQLGQGGVEHFAKRLVQSVDVHGQRARDLELLDDHLEDKTSDFRFSRRAFGESVLAHREC